MSTALEDALILKNFGFQRLLPAKAGEAYFSRWITTNYPGEYSTEQGCVEAHVSVSIACMRKVQLEARGVTVLDAYIALVPMVIAAMDKLQAELEGRG